MAQKNGFLDTYATYLHYKIKRKTILCQIMPIFACV